MNESIDSTPWLKNTPALLVEDSEDDILLLDLAWEKTQIQTEFVVVSNGREAIEYLSGPDVQRIHQPLH